MTAGLKTIISLSFVSPLYPYRSARLAARSSQRRFSPPPDPRDRLPPRHPLLRPLQAIPTAPRRRDLRPRSDPKLGLRTMR
jgi:hypothetical protein